MKIRTTMGKIQPLGASPDGKGIQFAFVSAWQDCGVIIYEKESGEELQRIAFPAEYRVGNIHTMCVHGLNEEFLYAFYEGETVVCDRYARHFEGGRKYGDFTGLQERKACFQASDYDWGEDRNPNIPYEQSFVYCMHVRGFTKHTSSKVKNRGTFRGVIEKIPYLKELGVTTLELQPVYEFDEVYKAEEAYRTEELHMQESGELKKNYWGYTNGYYYAPKNSYTAGEDSAAEFCDLIKALHANRMEAVLQFYFPAEVTEWEVTDILRYWVTEYHIDGFHIKGQCAPMNLICTDPCFAQTKIWYYDFPENSSHTGTVQGLIQRYGQAGSQQNDRYLGIYKDDFCYAMRRFLKGDEGMVGTVLELMRNQPEHAGCINYITNYEGFTLMDMVSYDRKHNEENGENNKDGNDFNFSWNCGAEGTSRKKTVMSLRMKQIKNALCLLFLSQGTPLLFMGDEFGNSQGGNNNPYGLDNEITWLNWKNLDKNKEIYDFVKTLMTLRREHPILRKETQLRLMDYISCGCPDLSYHGEAPWMPNMEQYSRHVGLMMCGKYARIDRKTEDDSFYIGINMHWEKHEFSLPKLSKGQGWKCVLGTDHELKWSVSEDGQSVELPPRSIYVYCSKIKDENSES